MLISVKHNFVFLCTPKCASNSIEQMLERFSDISLSGPPYFRHTNYRRYSKFIKPYLMETTGKDSFETICLLREPLSWLYSHYRFRSRLELRNQNHPSFSKCTYGIQFSDFIEAYMLPDPPPYASVRSQFSFVKNDANEAGVAKIFLYEKLDDFLEYMSQKVARKLKMNYKNISPKKGTESRISSLTDYANRKISNRFNWKQSVPAVKAEIDIEDELLGSLRQFIANDFALYERVKASHE